MHQSSLALTTLPDNTSLPGDATGFSIGWEHAQHGLVPAPELLLEGTAVSQGWRAARAVFGRRTLASTRALRQWLALRSLAWREGVDFDTAGLGPAELAHLATSHCPVRQRPLGGLACGDDAPVVFRLNPGAGYRPGHLVVLSRAAARAAQDTTVADALRSAGAADAGGMDVRGLHAVAWRRLAVLLSFARPLAFHAAARLPLLVLPTPGVIPLHAVQALQLQLTLQFLQPGWSARTRGLAAGLQQEAQRTDFHLFISALASRVLEAASQHCAGENGKLCPSTLEDAWLHERVQRRWHQLAMALGEGGCEALLQRVQALQCQAAQGVGSGLRRQQAGTRLHPPAFTSRAAAAAPSSPALSSASAAAAAAGRHTLARQPLHPHCPVKPALQAQR